VRVAASYRYVEECTLAACGPKGVTASCPKGRLDVGNGPVKGFAEMTIRSPDEDQGSAQHRKLTPASGVTPPLRTAPLLTLHRSPSFAPAA
jgi:hypothetical protein